MDFESRVRLEFRGTWLSSDGDLVMMRELSDVLGLSGLPFGAARQPPGQERLPPFHQLNGLFRQSVYGRLVSRAPRAMVCRVQKMPEMAMRRQRHGRSRS